jgi:hypothetical protein
VVVDLVLLVVKVQQVLILLFPLLLPLEVVLVLVIKEMERWVVQVAAEEVMLLLAVMAVLELQTKVMQEVTVVKIQAALMQICGVEEEEAQAALAEMLLMLLAEPLVQV